MVALEFGALLFAAGLGAAQILTSTYTSENCFTSYGRTASLASVPTSYNISTSQGQGFARGTSTPLVTVTPAPVTSTSTSIITRTVTVSFSEPPLQTDIVTTTTTFTVSSIVSSISTFTSVVAQNFTTTLTATTTIPTQPGFTPVAADVAAQGGIPSRRKRWHNFNYPLYGLQDFETLIPVNNTNSTRCRFGPGEEGEGLALFPPQAPTGVSCSRRVRIEAIRMFWKTISTTSTVTAQPSTVTATAFSTTTSVSSIGSRPISGRTTITSSTTTTITSTTAVVSTVSSTLTNTITINAPAETAFAACALNNTVTRVNGNPIIFGVQDLLAEVITEDAVECCITCQITANCTTSAYYVDGGNCLLGNGTGTDVNQFYTTAGDTDVIFAVSNGAGTPVVGNWAWDGLVDSFSKARRRYSRT